MRELYQHRNDHLEQREVNHVHGVTVERFRPGRRFHLLGKSASCGSSAFCFYFSMGFMHGELPVSSKSVRAFPVTSVSGAVAVIFSTEVNKRMIYSEASRRQIVVYSI